MKRFSLSLLGLALAGCLNLHDTTVSPSGEKEALLLSETSRFASLQGVEVRGEITDTFPPDAKAGQVPTGWYSRGVAYYYRPLVEGLSIEVEAGKETVSNVANHEVCHATHPHHDIKHWNCMDRYAVPTYPRP